MTMPSNPSERVEWSSFSFFGAESKGEADLKAPDDAPSGFVGMSAEGCR